MCFLFWCQEDHTGPVHAPCGPRTMESSAPAPVLAVLSPPRCSITSARPRRTRSGHPLQLELLPGVRQAPIPDTLAPMLPTLTTAPFSHPDWLFEPKLDGVRAITLVSHRT